MLKEFWIIGLWGERNYHLSLNDGKLIMVGENGCGKSTVLRIIYYTLAKKWGQLIKEDFERIKIIIGDEEKEFTKEQLGRPEEYLIAADDEVFSCFPIVFRQRCLDGDKDKVMAEDVLSILENMEYPEGIFDEEIEKLEKMASMVPDSIKEISEWLKNCFDQPILYMPTYRRIEKNPEIQKGDFKYRRRHKNYQACNSRSMKMEVSHIGMNDVNTAIHDLIAEIKSQYAKSSSQLNMDCFRGILGQDFKEVDSIPDEYMESESIEMIFESLNEEELLDVDKMQIKEKLVAIIGKTEIYDEYDKIVIYYYNMLIKRYESLKIIENQLEHFFYICNQYLSGKEFVYKPKSFEYTINVQSRNGTLKEMDIEQLSSGEKQIVALFSYIYLLVKRPGAIIIDEPELSLSVPWQETILEDIIKSKMCNQLIVATQSPFVYDNSLLSYAHAMEEFLTVE
ncbi:MAG: AAA family ATPase [Lachnospiraceae bacterium]|nr:AAA family ATPase [Lachnospiraceae bacterium]